MVNTNSKKNKNASSASNKSPYAAAANLLTKVIDEKCSFKRLVYSKEGSLRCSKTTYAQVCQVLTYKATLDQLLEQVPALQKDVHNSGLLYVLLYELLLGPNKKIQGGGVVKRKIMQYEEKLTKALETCSVPNQTQHKFPRYARVNTVLTNMDKVCASLRKQQDEPLIEFYVDPHIPDLLVFPPNLISHIKGDNKKLTPQQQTLNQMIDRGELILQDKSSCLTALCLVHGFEEEAPNGEFIDACAAPGNKTQHLAALLHDKNAIIHAFDRSEERLNAMSKRMQQLAPKRKIQTQVQDFLKTNPNDYPKVNAILLDPSCSGSGIYTAPDRWTEEKVDDERIDSLANFQEMTLKHAMSYESVTRIVYSTCSLHDRENEQVVKAVLQAKGEEWQVVAPKCLENWKRRGHAMEGVSEEQAKCMIRACDQDETNGFFVCCLERKLKKKGSKKHQWKGIVVPKGVEVYSGQFVDKTTPTAKKSNEVKASAKATPEKSSKTNAVAKKGDSGKKDMKEKEPSNVAKKETNSGKDTKPQSGDKVDNSHAKKISKKLAWKKRQMEQKQERLKKKKKQKTTTEAPTE